MRIFEWYTFSLKKVMPYAETLPAILKFLEENGYAYDRALFRLEQVLEKPLQQDKEPLYRIKRDFPGMADYPVERLPGALAGQAVLSNMPRIENGEFVFPGYPPVSVDDLCRIAEKIPRSYPLYEALMYVDNIHWFGSPNPQPATGYIQGVRKASYFSNCLVTQKAFKVNNNPVRAIMEVTPETEGPPMDPGPVLRNLKQAFGEPYDRVQICMFPYEERLRLNQTFTRFRPFFNQKRREMQSLSLPSGHPFGTRMYKTTRISPRERFSIPGSAPFFRRVLEAEGYRYRPSKVHGCRYVKRLPHNHCISLSVSGARGELFVKLNCGGYNYTVSHLLMNVYCNNREDMQRFLQDTCVILRKWEAEIAPELHRLFGKTPAWFYHSGMSSQNAYIEQEPVEEPCRVHGKF